MFRKSKFQRKRGTTTTPPCIFTSLFVNACIPTTYTKHSTPNTFSSLVVSTPGRLYLENVSMHPHPTLFNPSIASLLPYICIRSFQLRLIKNDFYVLRKKKTRFHNSGVYGISWNIHSKKEAVSRDTKRSGIRRVDY